MSMAVIAVAAMVIGYRNTSAALETAETRLKMALTVVEELFTRVSEDDLLNEPGMQGLRKDLLGRALKHYQLFLNESGGDPTIREETAAARARVGLIAQLTGDRDEARRQLETAATTQRELLTETPDHVARMKAARDQLERVGEFVGLRRSGTRRGLFSRSRNVTRTSGGLTSGQRRICPAIGQHSNEYRADRGESRPRRNRRRN
ncbi:MAG: hypothetical protein QM811_19570 [Pirellulales bacterium]